MAKKINKKKQRIRIAIVAVVGIAIVIGVLFGSIKLISFGANLLFNRGGNQVNTIILGDGQKIATIVNDIGKKLAANQNAQDEAKQKVLEQSEATKQAQREKATLTPIKEGIESYLKEHNLDTSQISYKVIDIETGKAVQSSNADQNMLAGSVYKLPLCMLWYDRVNAGKAKMNDLLEWDETVTESGGYIETIYEEGDKIPLEEVLGDTLLFSDNVGGHILYNAYGGWQKFKEDAARYSTHKQNEEFYSQVNYLNAEYMCDVMRVLYDNQEAYSEAIFYLQEASPDDYLNHKIQVNMVQKVGWYNDHVNSCGLSLEGRPYIFCVFTNYGDDALEIMGDLNEIVYNYINVDLAQLLA